MRNVGSLMQGIKDKKIKCKIDGCNNNWIWTGESQLNALLKGETEPPRRMCERCYSLYLQKQDLQIPCSNPDCSGTWKYFKIAQVQDEVNNRKPPKKLCLDCMTKSSELSPIQLPCKIKGCDNTWTWSVKDQIISGNNTPPQRMCGSCYETFQKLEDNQIKCKVKTCNNTWTWNKFSQLEALKSGKQHPMRFCESCFKTFQKLEDKQIKCKIAECNNTWTWTKFAQLEHLAAGKSLEEPPHRMCSACSDSYFEVHEEVHKCKIPSCNNTWTEKKGSVFRRKLNNEPPPQRLCDECYSALQQLEDIEVKCKYSKYGCTNTWTWTRYQQLKLIKSTNKQNPNPPFRACQSCEQILHNTPKEIHCEKCGKFIMSLSSEDLLKIHFGKRTHPMTLCSNCNK